MDLQNSALILFPPLQCRIRLLHSNLIVRALDCLILVFVRRIPCGKVVRQPSHVIRVINVVHHEPVILILVIPE